MRSSSKKHFLILGMAFFQGFFESLVKLYIFLKACSSKQGAQLLSFNEIVSHEICATKILHIKKVSEKKTKIAVVAS